LTFNLQNPIIKHLPHILVQTDRLIKVSDVEIRSITLDLIAHFFDAPPLDRTAPGVGLLHSVVLKLFKVAQSQLADYFLGLQELRDQSLGLRATQLVYSQMSLFEVGWVLSLLA